MGIIRISDNYRIVTEDNCLTVQKRLGKTDKALSEKTKSWGNNKYYHTMPEALKCLHKYYVVDKIDELGEVDLPQYIKIVREATEYIGNLIQE